MSAFIAWAARHSVDIDDALSWREAQMELRCGEPNQQTKYTLREGSGPGRKVDYRRNGSERHGSDSVMGVSQSDGSCDIRTGSTQTC